MDSVSPNPSATSISHQPSSLSLNNVDDLKETNSINDRLSSSELDVTDEPEAVIVCSGVHCMSLGVMSRYNCRWKLKMTMSKPPLLS